MKKHIEINEDFGIVYRNDGWIDIYNDPSTLGFSIKSIDAVIEALLEIKRHAAGE